MAFPPVVRPLQGPSRWGPYQTVRKTFEHGRRFRLCHRGGHQEPYPFSPFLIYDPRPSDNRQPVMRGSDGMWMELYPRKAITSSGSEKSALRMRTCCAPDRSPSRQTKRIMCGGPCSADHGDCCSASHNSNLRMVSSLSSASASQGRPNKSLPFQPTLCGADPRGRNEPCPAGPAEVAGALRLAVSSK